MLKLLLIALSVIGRCAGSNILVNDHVTVSGLQDIYKRLGSLEVTVKRQADENIELKQTVEDLREENQKLRNQVNTLQAHDSDLKNVLNELQETVAQLNACSKEHVDNTKDVIEYIKEQTYGGETNLNTSSERTNVFKMQTKTQTKGKEIERRVAGHIRRRETEQKIAFFATLGNHLSHLGANQNIAFDQIITNIGSGYNSHAGDFRAPVAGTYVFSVTLMAYASTTTHYHIVRNSTTVANIYIRGAEAPYASSSMTAVLELQKGEDVAIRNVDTDKMLHGSSYSTFSGFLLDEDFSNPAIVGKK